VEQVKEEKSVAGVSGEQSRHAPTAHHAV